MLLVIAADEGVMPQSKEHLAICNLLKIKKGLIVLTKSDLVDKDWLALIKDDIGNLVKGTFLDGAEIISVSSKTGYNLDLLKEKIRDIASGVEPKPVKGIFRLPVDRVFTLKGFGTVITGTAISGSISLNDSVEIIPEDIKTKIRGLQSHGRSLKTAYAGQRVAINLQGIEKQQVKRGDVLSFPDKIKPTSVFDARIEFLKDAPLPGLRNRSLVHLHTGTSEVTGRVIIYGKDSLTPGDNAYCQFRLQDKIAVMSGDRYIIRRFSPLLTIGGGEILDPSPRRRKRKEGCEDLRIFEHGSLEEKLLMKIFFDGISGITVSALEGWIKAELPDIRDTIKSLVKNGKAVQMENILLHKEAFNDFSQKTVSTIKAFHKENPLRAGIQKEAIRAVFKWLDQKVFEGLISHVNDIEFIKDIVKLKSFKISLSEDKEHVKANILKILNQSAFHPPTKDELVSRLSGTINNKELTELLKLMVSEGSIVRVNDDVFLSSENYNRMIKRLERFFKTKSEMTVGEFRDILGTSRKYAIPFLEYLDSNKITLRAGDIRKFLIKG